MNDLNNTAIHIAQIQANTTVAIAAIAGIVMLMTIGAFVTTRKQSSP